MNRVLPSPLLSLTLFVMWLLLNQTVHPAHLLLGAVLAIVAPLLTRQFRPVIARVKKPLLIIQLMAHVFMDIMRSAINVGRLILFIRHEKLNSQFIRIPLDLTDPSGLAVLAGIINSTPGTVWVEIMPETGELSLHVFDLQEEAWWINTIKNRYEKPLMAIFESGACP